MQVLHYRFRLTVKETKARRGLGPTATDWQDLGHLALGSELFTALLLHGAGPADSPLSQLDCIDFSIQPTSLTCFSYRYLLGVFDMCSVLI